MTKNCELLVLLVGSPSFFSQIPLRTNRSQSLILYDCVQPISTILLNQVLSQLCQLLDQHQLPQSLNVAQFQMLQGVI